MRLIGIFALFALATSAIAETSTRITLMTLAVEGYDRLKDVRSYLDVGISSERTETGLDCGFHTPRKGTTAAAQAWAPFDFYTNILSKTQQEEHEAKGGLGEPDVFFAGDDRNRNSQSQSHRWTRKVADNFQGCIDFLEPKRDKSNFSFLVKFTRGLIQFESLFSARTWAEGDRCRAAIFDCTRKVRESDGTTRCESDGWTRKVLELRAQADLKGGLSDTLFRVTEEKTKNDVASIQGLFQDVDGQQRNVGKPYLETLATK